MPAVYAGRFLKGCDDLYTAIVTGGSRGIGAAAALELAKLGYAVVVNYRKNQSAAEDVVRKITELGGNAVAVKCDISCLNDVKALFEEADRLGNVEVLVNNAGISYIGLLQDMRLGDIRKQISVNLFGAVICSQEAARRMVSRKSGAIINVASMWGEVGASCEAVYSACKAGIIGFTKALAKELGPSGVRVNCVSPGVIRTDMNSELTEETLRELAEETPLLRIGTPEDVAKAIAFLARGDSSFITGQVLPVNGGIIV